MLTFFAISADSFGKLLTSSVLVASNPAFIDAFF